MYKIRMWIILLSFMLVVSSCRTSPSAKISGNLKKWHTITLTFTGPNSGEKNSPNPFLNFRLNVTFKKGEKTVLVPGYYAADGNASETSADHGNKWRVHFMPDETGEWEFSASFRTGKNIAVSADPQAGETTAFDGTVGSFIVEETEKPGRDFRTRGLLKYTGHHYLQFAETGDFFIKGGADSPENFLAYFEFDGAEQDGQISINKADGRQGEAKKILQGGTHKYEPHRMDWREGNPSWQNGKGKNIIGALNYLSDKGMNSVYFLTMNVMGDGKDVWPWISDQERYRFDCSKLDQWDIVFSHMQKKGLLMHVVTQETENDQLLDGGELGLQRKLYYRELIARFSHHPALVWNLGEENTNTDEQRKSFAKYIRELDPYAHPIVVHTFPKKYDAVYNPLLGFSDFEGPSLQMGNPKLTHAETIKWVERSEKAGRKWFVCLDEIGPASTGVKPDADDYWHDDVRHYSLWGNLMAGGAGCEWYFGYKYPHNDLNCEDWRSRDHLWDLTHYAVDFFQKYIPFTEMKSRDDLISKDTGYCFAKPGSVYVVYLANGGTSTLKVGTGKYSIKWYNPREGGELVDGNRKSLSGPGLQNIGSPPKDYTKDWVALVKRE